MGVSREESIKALYDSLIDVSEPVPNGLTREVYYTIKAQFKGDIEKAVEAYKLGNTPQLAQIEKEFSKKHIQYWLFQPYNFDILSDYLVLRPPNGFKLYISKSKLSGWTVDDIASVCSNYLLCRVRVEHKKAYALTVQLLKAKADLDTAKIICSHIPPVVALTIGLGWKISPELLRLNLARFCATIKLFGDGIMPVIQLTGRGTGKTTHAVWCAETLGFGYVSKIPTVARLIMDARTGQFGLIYKSGVIFDEFTDLSALDKARAQQITDVIKTGLSHGLWTRETATPKGVNPTVQRYLPFIWYGNTEEEAFDSRKWLISWLRNNVGIQAPDAFVDRFALIDVTTTVNPEVASMLTFKIMKASVARGILELVKQRAEAKPVDEYFRESKLVGRQKLYSARVRAVLESLLSTDEIQVKFSADEVDAIVKQNNWGETLDLLKEIIESLSGEGT